MVRFLSATGLKKGKFMNTYQVPVWLTMATVFVLTAILWWGLANWRHCPLMDSRTFQKTVLLFVRCVGCCYKYLGYEYTKHLEVQISFSRLRILLFRCEHCVVGILYILSRLRILPFRCEHCVVGILYILSR